ncbi:MAG: hydrogenobyrinic acid a,c-diamide synthase (glutamine-hydrolyzing) [Candidatus Methanomethylophilaceae archaeon]|nr:hydrogenobyrinic acid a,c-diamide synthase (glutamine-hydrolyzing) [Candidatus Methanomethylophilaceae archaeon]
MKGVVIAGAGSGVGKTSIATGIMSSLSRRMEVQPFKVGPDFIDPMYHTVATGRRSRNLDTFMVPESRIRGVVGNASKGADICIVEGVRGLYEGLSGASDQCSTAEMAKILRFPVVLVMDARSLTRSAAAMINGLVTFDPGVDVRGVILNNVSGKQHEDKLREAIGRYCDMDIVGVVRRHEGCELKNRHLGLKTVDGSSADDVKGLEALADDLDMDVFMGICESCDAEFPEEAPFVEHDCRAKAAVPMDDAYCFYYSENLECLEAAGMEVETFSPLSGDPLPDADMYYLGGGYPELYAGRISENRDFLEGLKAASDEGRPVLGECGGLMTMCESIVQKDGSRHKMAGIFDAEAVMCGRHGPKYVIADSTSDNPLFKGMIRGHEFHYSELSMKSEHRYGFRMERGIGIKDGMDGLCAGNSIGCYVHQNALSA